MSPAYQPQPYLRRSSGRSVGSISANNDCFAIQLGGTSYSMTEDTRRNNNNHDRKWGRGVEQRQPVLLPPSSSSLTTPTLLQLPKMLSYSSSTVNDNGSDDTGVTESSSSRRISSSSRSSKIRNNNESTPATRRKPSNIIIHGNGSGSGNEWDGNTNNAKYGEYYYYIQFSRVFQRHVVHRRSKHPSTGTWTSAAVTTTSNAIDNINIKPGFSKIKENDVEGDDDEVIQSFLFLDEATASYPQAHILPPKDLRFSPPSCTLNDDFYHVNDSKDNGDEKKTKTFKYHRSSIDSNIEENECETTIAGMGMYTLCDFEYNIVGNDGALYTSSPISNQLTSIFRDTTSTAAASSYSHDEAHAALRTLLQLVSSTQSSSNSNSIPRHFFNLDVRRFALMGHTPQSIQANYARVVTLLGGAYANSVGQPQQTIIDDEDDDDNSTFVGLSMSPSEITDTLQNFPMLLLYSCDELEFFLRFLITPLPKLGSIPSVTMVADRVGGDTATTSSTGNVSVDCKFE